MVQGNKSSPTILQSSEINVWKCSFSLVSIDRTRTWKKFYSRLRKAGEEISVCYYGFAQVPHFQLEERKSFRFRSQTLGYGKIYGRGVCLSSTVLLTSHTTFHSYARSPEKVTNTWERHDSNLPPIFARNLWSFLFPYMMNCLGSDHFFIWISIAVRVLFALRHIRRIAKLMTWKALNLKLPLARYFTVSEMKFLEKITSLRFPPQVSFSPFSSSSRESFLTKSRASRHRDSERRAKASRANGPHWFLASGRLDVPDPTIWSATAGQSVSPFPISNFHHELWTLEAYLHSFAVIGVEN